MSLIDSSNLKNFSALTVGTGAALLLAYNTFKTENSGPIEDADGNVKEYKDLMYASESTEEIRYAEAQSWFSKKLQAVFHGIIVNFCLPHYNMEIQNARNKDIDYNKQGFTLVDSPMDDCDWNVKENREEFYKLMEPKLRELHPEVETVYWIDQAFLLRGGPGQNPPAINGVHIDYYPDPKVATEWCGYDALSHFDAILGIWKPIHMNNPVQDLPLAIMDGSTCTEDRVIPTFGELTQTTIEGKQNRIKFLSASIKHNEDQKWFYYKDQTKDEVLIFRHYTKEEFFSNPHCSLGLPNVPSNIDSRRSMETRVGLIFKK